MTKRTNQNIAYRAYAKENLISITVRLEYNRVPECIAFLRFSQGFDKNGARSYDTNNAIVIKLNLLELAALGKAFAYAAKNSGNSTYVKYANSALSSKTEEQQIKKLTLTKQYLTLGTDERYIGIRFTRYEMEAIAEDIAQMVQICNEKVWHGF